MIKKIVELYKQITGITSLEKQVKLLQNEVDSHRDFVIDKIAELRGHTRVDADVGYRGNNTIVLTGVYKRRGFVRFYDVGDGEFERLIIQMKEMSKYALVRNIDKPPSFHGRFDL